MSETTLNRRYPLDTTKVLQHTAFASACFKGLPKRRMKLKDIHALLDCVDDYVASCGLRLHIRKINNIRKKYLKK